MTQFRSTHNLPFLSRHWKNPFNLMGWYEYRIGTCHGQWIATNTTYDILSIINDYPGNGHFQDVLDWFENSCKRDNRSLRFLEILNKQFADHLVSKRGFVYQSDVNLIKHFK